MKSNEAKCDYMARQNSSLRPSYRGSLCSFLFSSNQIQLNTSCNHCVLHGGVSSHMSHTYLPASMHVREVWSHLPHSIGCVVQFWMNRSVPHVWVLSMQLSIPHTPCDSPPHPSKTSLVAGHLAAASSAHCPQVFDFTVPPVGQNETR